MIEIVDSSFETSAPNVSLVPFNDQFNEVAFMARSNVGKSSLLNSLSNRKSLAKVSGTPGKTQLINYFNITFMDRDTGEKSQAKFIDLPGFGYAKVAKSIKADWHKNLTEFIEARRQIRLFIHLVDARHTDLEIDRSVEDFLNQITDTDQRVLKVFTKIDKLNQKELGELKKAFPEAILISNSKRRGIDKLVQEIHKNLFGALTHE